MATASTCRPGSAARAVAAALALGLCASCSYDFSGALRCTDGERGQGESDVDCGSDCPARCAIGQSCGSTTDCGGAGIACEAGRCTAPAMGRWELLREGTPPARLGATLAFVDDRTAILHGGTPVSQSIDETWRWAGASDDWSELDKQTTPGPRHFAAMVETGGGTLLLAGGLQQLEGELPIALPDAWSWGADDRWAHESAMPVASAGLAAAYVDDLQVVVVFGGYVPGADAARVPSGQTLELAGGAWIEIHGGGPSPRFHHAMAYDGRHRQVVLFGGTTDLDAKADFSADTWLYDPAAHTWREATPAPGSSESAGPSARYAHRMVYDEHRGRIVLFGGRLGGSDEANDVWEWDGERWREVLPDDPAGSATPGVPRGRFAPGMAYERGAHRVLVHGGSLTGYMALDETWGLAFVGQPCTGPADCGGRPCTTGVCCDDVSCPQGQVCNDPRALGTCFDPSAAAP
ncbi:MAG: kelch repeat-containing protein [Polyangiaceae bacterium]